MIRTLDDVGKVVALATELGLDKHKIESVRKFAVRITELFDQYRNGRQS